MCIEFLFELANVYKVFARTGSMYIKFRVEDRQCIWSFGSHWPMYKEFCWRPLSTLFHYVRCRKMAIALCSPDGKRHFFLRCNFFKQQLLIWPSAKLSLKVYEVWDLNLARPSTLQTIKDERLFCLSRAETHEFEFWNDCNAALTDIGLQWRLPAIGQQRSIEQIDFDSSPTYDISSSE